MVYEIAGVEFNIGSPKQLGEILFEKLEIPGGKKTKTGWATGAEFLTEMDHPIAQEIINYRELTKLKSTYADSLPKMIGADGRVHTTFNQTVAATGRLSSIDPNLQNIPVRTELGRQIRRAFESAPGFQLASFDYSQIELRVLAHMSHDPNLVAAFQKHEDVHTVTAAIMFKVDESAVTKQQRNLAKLLNYAVLYGVTDFGLANQLGQGFSRTEAAALIKDYNERFPAVKAFTQGVVEEARAKGFTATLTGRRRLFPEIHAANRGVRQYAERQAMNAPMQGAAADMMKLAMIKVRKTLVGRRTKMLLTVHDELVFDFDPTEQDLVAQLRADMANALPLDVPVVVDAKVGQNWSEMTGIR
jgi:DNA polymerase-1